MVFVLQFLATGDGVEVARRTGYGNPYLASHHLFKRRDVRQMIKMFRAHNAEVIRQAGIDALSGARARAVASLCDYLEITPDGTVVFRDPADLTPQALAALADWQTDDTNRVTSIRLKAPGDTLSELARLAGFTGTLDDSRRSGGLTGREIMEHDMGY